MYFYGSTRRIRLGQPTAQRSTDFFLISSHVIIKIIQNDDEIQLLEEHPFELRLIFVKHSPHFVSKFSYGFRGKPGGGGEVFTRDEFTYARAVVSVRYFIAQNENNAYHEPLAHLFTSDEVLDRLNATHRNEVDALVARHMIIDQMIHDSFHFPSKNSGTVNHPKQVVIFGAGFDTRSNTYADIWPVQKWFEIDLPHPQQFKVEKLKEHDVIDPPNLSRLAMDLTEGGWKQALEAKGWDSAAPTIYVLEGLLYYLPIEKVKELLYAIPSVPQSKIILTMIDEPLQQLFKVALGLDPYVVNLKNMKQAGIFKRLRQEKYFKMTQNVSTGRPTKCRGLNRTKIWVTKSTILKMISKWNRFKFLFLRPTERVMEFIAM